MEESMEENVETLFNYVDNKEECIKSVMFRLTESLIGFQHESCGCNFFRRKLSTLSVVMKVKCNSKKEKVEENNETAKVAEVILNTCFQTLCDIQDGKDLCIPILCDMLCYSLVLLLQSQKSEKVMLIVQNSRSRLTELITVPSLMCEDSHNSSVEVTKVGINLRIWESLIVTIVSWRDTPNPVIVSRSTSLMDIMTLFDDEFFALLLKLISFENDILTSQTLLCLIPNLVTLTESNSILQKLWKHITDIFYSNGNDHRVSSHIFLIMCALSDFFIPCGYNTSYSFPIGQNNDFWWILQYGLVSCDALMRKQALYLLKRAVERESAKPEITRSNSKKVFWWNQQKDQQFRKTWDELFLVLEVLEEKQMHLIEPVQPVLLLLLRANHELIIHSSWILCVIQRALRHECNAVIKWGILSFTKLDGNVMFTNVDYLFILSSLLNALNSSSLYIIDSNNLSPPNIVESLRLFFIGIANSKLNISQLFFRSLLNSVVRVSWGPVALFYVVFALSAVPKCSIWNVNDVQLLKSFLVDALCTQVVHIRGAIQSFFIETLINLADEQQLQVDSIADVMGSFRKQEALKRGSYTWNKVTSWLKCFITGEAAFRFTLKCFSSLAQGNLENEKQSAARMIVLLSDADLICLNMYDTCHRYSLNCTLLSVVDYFKNCQERIYVCHTKQDSCLEMLVNLLEESQPIGENDLTGKYVLSLIRFVLPGTFYCIKNALFSAYNLECFDTISLYVHSLTVFVQEPKLHAELLEHAQIIQDASFSIINSESEKNSPMSRYFSIKILSWISHLLSQCRNENNIAHVQNFSLYKKQMKFLENMLQWRDFNHVLTKTKQDTFLTRDMQTLWGRLVSEYIQGIWLLLNFYIECQIECSVMYMNYELASHILKEAGQALELGGRGILFPVMSVMQNIIHELVTGETKEDIKRFLLLCWTGIFEHRKSDLFWVTMEKFIKMTYQKSLMNTAEMNETLLTFAQKIFKHGETITGLCNLLIQRLQEEANHYFLGFFQPFVEILVNALVFGPVHRRDRKIDDETCTFIRSLGEMCCINDISASFSDIEVRARGIALLLSCIHNAQCNDVNILVQITHLLMDKDLQISQQKTCYFADSYHHRYRNRIMQTLLLLQPLLPEEECEKLSSYLQHSLLKENHQPSIRYLQEWLLIRMLCKRNPAHSQILSVLQAASEIRPGSLCSFISIVYHIARILPEDDGLEEFIDEGMSDILPCTMSQHFNIRLYAQVSFSKLWEYADQKAFHHVTCKYHVVYSCIMSNLHAPCNVKNVRKLEDFYFKTFHPLNHFSLQTIFYDLPRLTNVTQEEWIPVDVLLTCGVKITNFPLLNPNSDLENCQHISTLIKSGLGPDDCDTVCDQVVNVQKKIIPWKSMVPDPEMLLSISENALRRKQVILEDGLIVVASLIDRPPNLGGLSRTCEAFGVSQYVLGSLKYVEDKQFQSLSVSAERWISVAEVKPHELPQYLDGMKRKGYAIVGAEQTANSVPLHEVKFPKRTILLLGNEKEGVPVNLLPLLDLCVEVPQQGVIRSLNVHVTGAIFIWEYARQHNEQHKN